jgi:hypothetical protein
MYNSYYTAKQVPGYSCAKIIAGAPGPWFAGGLLVPGEPGTRCADNNLGTGVTRT